MFKKSFIYSLCLIALGIASYQLTSKQSPTALIPTMLGTLTLLCALVGLKENFTKHAMHTTVMLSLVGFFGSAPGLYKAIQLSRGVDITRPGAAIAQTLMALLCAGYIFLSVRWFLHNRKARKATVRVQ